MSRAGRYRRWLVAAVAAALLAGLAVVSTPPASTVTSAPPASTTLEAAGRPAPPEPPSPPPDPNLPKTAAITELLRSRADAVLHRDEAGFLATLDPGADAAFVTAQRELYLNLEGVPLSQWRYRVDPAGALDGIETLPSAPRGDELWAPRVELYYALTGVDVVPTSRSMGYLFVRRGESWFLNSDSALESRSRRTWRGPWDFGPCHVLTTEQGMVIGHRSNQTMVQRVARELDAAVRAVTDVWGHRWSERVAVVLPETTRELQLTVGPEFAVDSFAAVALADRVDHDTDVVEGPRVVFNLKTTARLSISALRVVLRHEITHIAARSVTVDGAGMWLLEGFSDYVGYRNSGIAPTEAAPDLTKKVHTEGPPETLPVDSDFRAGDHRLDLAYQASWSVSLYLAERFGEPKLVELYRRLAAVGQASDATVDSIMVEVLGLGRAAVVAEWREFVKRTFG